MEAAAWDESCLVIRTGVDSGCFLAVPKFLLRLSDFFLGGEGEFFWYIFLGLRQFLLGWNCVPTEGV